MDILQVISQILHDKQLTLVTAESCTGGWVAKKITDLAGSSSIFDRGFVTYSNQAKHEMLGVSNNTLETYGAVSEEVVIEMVQGALRNSHADIALSISGVAGPGGGTEEKPVGLVCFGWMIKNEEAIAHSMHFYGDRNSVREQSVEYSLNGIKKQIGGTLR